MSEEVFRFKQFAVQQDHCSMKVGTDAVLLGAWANAVNPSSILDIGTGTGIIALMLAQRFPCPVHALEIDKETALLADANFSASPWKDRMFVYPVSLQHFSADAPRSFDLIVSNPPYFESHKDVHHSARYIARHSDMLPAADLAKGISQLLSERGVCCLIFPEKHALEFIREARPFGLFPNKITKVKTLQEKPAKRLLIMLSRNRTEEITGDEMTIRQSESGPFSDAFVALTRDYYLHF